MHKLLEINLSPSQSNAFNMLESEACDELAKGGAKGGGKTVFGCKWVYYKIKQLIQFYGLKPSDHPVVLGFVGRKQAVDFTSTTLNTWKRDIPSDAYEIKEQRKLIVVDKCAAVQFGGLDDTETIQKFNSAEYSFVWVDQAEECTEKDIGMLRGTLRLTINGRVPKFKCLWTCNPVISDDPDFMWLKRDFIDNPKPGFQFLKALYTDNPFLPENYGQQLDRAFAFNPDLLAAYKLGEWERARAANVIIPSQIVKKNVENKLANNEQYVKRVTVCDIAGGDDDGEELSPNDETVIYDLENTKIVDQEIYSHKEEMDTCGRIVAHQKRNESTVICIDRVGLGSAVYSRLKEIYEKDIAAGKIVIYGFDSRIKPPAGIDEETYYNYKTYAWFTASKKLFSEFRCNLPNDPVLITQLSAVTFYFHSGGKMAVTPKRKLRKKLTCSPDRAECYIMGLDALQYAKTKLNVKQDGGWNGRTFIPLRPGKSGFRELIPS